MIKLGASDIDDIKLGSDQVDAVYLGDIKVFPLVSTGVIYRNFTPQARSGRFVIQNDGTTGDCW